MRPDLTRRAVLRGLAMAGAASAMARSALAQGLKFGAYDEFTLYNSEQGPLKDDVLFIFHGFGSAMPNGTYTDLFRNLSKYYSVIGFNYDYFDLTANDAEMDLVWEKLLKDKNVTFAGTSLGGFMANYYAEKLGVDRLVLVNPVTDPPVQLRQLVGTFHSEKRKKDITVTEEQIDRYKDRVGLAKPGITRLVILTRDDETLDYHLAEEKFATPDDKVVIFDEGGHSPDLGEDAYLNVIKDFLIPKG